MSKGLLAVLANLAEAKHVLLAEVAHAENDAALEPTNNKLACNITTTQLDQRRARSDDGQTRDKHIVRVATQKSKDEKMTTFLSRSEP